LSTSIDNSPLPLLLLLSPLGNRLSPGDWFPLSNDVKLRLGFEDADKKATMKLKDKVTLITGGSRGISPGSVAGVRPDNLINLSETAVAGERGAFKSFQPFKPFNV
jgi:hypothetical protein